MSQKYEGCADLRKTEKLVMFFACSLCSIIKCRFCYSTHSGCVFLFSGFWTYVNFAVVWRLGYNSVRHSLARTHLSGSARICAHIGMLGNPNQSTECFIRGGAQVPRQLVHLDKPVKAWCMKSQIPALLSFKRTHEGHDWGLTCAWN